MKVNIGGDRLGSGAKMNVELHNYYRSTHNLSKKVQTSLAPGVLYPIYTNIGLNGDKFDIDIEQITRTLPTQGPLFSSFKYQIDFFVCPIRLYHGILHNNPINIGLKMKDVILPKYRLTTRYKDLNGKINTKQIDQTNLWKYLGMSGLGMNVGEYVDSNILRKVNGVPALAYYDIFKNYYANKQEDNAYMIKSNQVIGKITGCMTTTIDGVGGEQTELNDEELVMNGQGQFYGNVLITGENLDRDMQVIIFSDNYTQEANVTLNDILRNVQYKGVRMGDMTITPNQIKFVLRNTEDCDFRIIIKQGQVSSEPLKLTSFPLENIDKMREELLKIGLGEEFIVNDVDYLPYNSFNHGSPLDLRTAMTGLCVKTYQSDLFNNWIKTETIEGANGIAEITKIDTSNGLELDTLNLAQKVYNMLNRIAVSGGTYEDWQEAVYTQSTIRKAETPIYVGGVSHEIMFEEVIATTEQTLQNGETQKLGSIGGRGRQVGKKGGHIKFTVEEPSIIMAIASLTPRISYSQGNKWFLTDIDTIDDMHKPALDGIGYQDLLVEQMAWTGYQWDEQENEVTRLSAGKVPAWLNYMTDVDECYGDFAAEEGYAFMVLNRNYQITDISESDSETILTTPQDITTYIDPKKYNYAFAYNKIDAQNFWSEIYFKIEARRLMSAKQIPNL